MAVYHVLKPGGYPDTLDDYETVTNKAAVADEIPHAMWGLGESVHVFHGERAPWEERDPYPDWVVSRGPRGGVRWEPA